MIYIHQLAFVNYKEDQQVDIKAECKAVAAKFVRRTDTFIQLAILGAAQIQQQMQVPKECALYLTSGQGNLGVFKRLCVQKAFDNAPPKPVDFINSLSNTAGFYIAQFLGLEGKSNNITHLNFPVQMALLLAKSELLLDKQKQVLIGGVDQLFADHNFMSSTYGIDKAITLGQGSNWLLLNKEADGALASLQIDKQEMDLNRLLNYLSRLEPSGDNTHIALSPLIKQSASEQLLAIKGIKQYHFQQAIGYYQTMVLAVLNDFILHHKGKLIYIDNYADKYRLIEINTQL